MVTEGAAVRTRGNTTFSNNFAYNDGGAIQSEFSCRVQIAGRTSFSNNTVGNFGGAVYADTGVIVALSGTQLYKNNSASSNGGAIRLSFAASVSITGQPAFHDNSAPDGSGGAIFCSSVPQATFKNANFTRNSALWGGAVALFSSGGSASSSSFSSASGSTSKSREIAILTSGSDYDPEDLTPSLTTTAGGGTTVTSLLSAESDGADDDGEEDPSTPVKFLDCLFESNDALEDGGALYSVASFDMIRGSKFFQNRATASGGALVHAGVMEEISDTTFVGNAAGNEGPAVLSLGLLSSMVGVTFDSNDFYCEEGEFGTETLIDKDLFGGADQCRFGRVCSRCASECDSELESAAELVDAETLPTCEEAPEGSRTTRRGATLATLEILPGFYRSSETSTDIRECFHKQACEGGSAVGTYCAEGYIGPYCAVCSAGYSPGYSRTCKSCMGDSKKSALVFAAAIGALALAAVVALVSRLVSVVEVGPRQQQQGSKGWRRTCSAWQARVRQTVPLTAVKIVVVVWQIVTQYSDVAGVEYPGAYQDFLSVVDVVNLDLGFILSFACVYDTNFYDRLLMATIGPVLVLGLLGCTYLVARRRNRHCEEAMRDVQRRHLSVTLFVMFVIYAAVSYTIFETFVCDTLDDGNSYLRADYSLTCDTPLHTAYRVYAGLAVLVYPVGIPCVFGWWLFKNRHELKQEDRESQAELRPAADLWEPYKPSAYYYEVRPFCGGVRRIALTGFAVFIYPDSSAQVAIVLLLAAVFMVVSEILCPFARPVEMWLYRAGHYVVFASMYLALLLRVDVSDERDQSQEVFSGVIVIAHVAMFLVVVAQGLLIFVGWDGLVDAPDALVGREVAVSAAIAGDNDNVDYWGVAGFRSRGGSIDDGSNENPGFLGAVAAAAAAAAAAADTSSGGAVAKGKAAKGGGGVDKPTKKKWETWERPLPNARDSFFSSARPPGLEAVAAAGATGKGGRDNAARFTSAPGRSGPSGGGGGVGRGRVAAGDSAKRVVRMSTSWASSAGGEAGKGPRLLTVPTSTSWAPGENGAAAPVTVAAAAAVAAHSNKTAPNNTSSLPVEKGHENDREETGGGRKNPPSRSSQKKHGGGYDRSRSGQDPPRKAGDPKSRVVRASTSWASSTGGGGAAPTAGGPQKGGHDRSSKAAGEDARIPVVRASASWTSSAAAGGGASYASKTALKTMPAGKGQPPADERGRKPATTPTQSLGPNKAGYGRSRKKAGEDPGYPVVRASASWASGREDGGGPASAAYLSETALKTMPTGIAVQEDERGRNPGTRPQSLGLTKGGYDRSLSAQDPPTKPLRFSDLMGQRTTNTYADDGGGAGGTAVGMTSSSRLSADPGATSGGMLALPRDRASSGPDPATRKSGGGVILDRVGSAASSKPGPTPAGRRGGRAAEGEEGTHKQAAGGGSGGRGRGHGVRRERESGTTAERVATKMSVPGDVDKLLPLHGQVGLFATQPPPNKAVGGNIRVWESSSGAETKGGRGQAAGRSPRDSLNAPSFTRDFRSLSGSSLGGDSGWSFGGLGGGGGGGGGFAGNAKRSFFPETLAPLCSSPAGAAAAATARGETTSSVVSSNTPASSRAGGRRLAGLLSRNRREIIDHYGNGGPEKAWGGSVTSKTRPTPAATGRGSGRGHVGGRERESGTTAAAAAAAAATPVERVATKMSPLGGVRKLLPLEGQVGLFATQPPPNKAVGGNIRVWESSSGAATKGGRGQAAGQSPRDSLNAPSFTRDFRSLSGSSLGGDSGWSFGGLGGGGGGGGGFAGNAKRSFYPETLAPLCSSPAGAAAAATARGETTSSVVSSNTPASSRVGGGRLAGLLSRNRREIIDHYGNGGPDARTDREAD
ncbi:unnamed protein product [Ectocarpus sp. 6 AP-2014]